MPRWVWLVVALVVLYGLWVMASRSPRLAGKFPFPPPPLFGVNRGGGVPGL